MKPRKANIRIEKPLIKFEGNFIPEDSKQFWFPFVSDFENICEQWAEMDIVFEFDSYNTGSHYWVTRIIKLLSDYSKKNSIKVSWYYITTDEFMEEAGMDYRDMFPELKIKLIERI